MNARANVARGCLLVCIVGLFAHQMHRRLLVLKKRPPPSVVVLLERKAPNATVAALPQTTPDAAYANVSEQDEDTIVWLSHPETDCISGTPIVSCRAFTQGNLSRLLDRDEAAMSLREWPSTPIEGPAFVHANGDVTVCKTRQRYAGGGCGAKAVVGDDAPCPSPDATVASVVVATQFWGDGYFHLVVEGFARIAQAQTEHPAFFRERTVHAHSPSPQAEPLARLLGLAVVSGNVLATHRLLAPPPTPCGGHRRSPHARWLRALLWPSIVPRPASPKTTGVLVVRRDGTRSILNHAALVARLNAQVHTGQEPVLEQLRLFAGAHTVVAPHGAGLANAVAMAAGGHVVELQAAPFNHCYLLWAYNLDLNYYSHYEPGATYNGAWAIDLERLLALPVFHLKARLTPK